MSVKYSLPFIILLMLLFLNLLPKHNYTVFVTYKHTTLKNDEQWRPLSTGGVSGTACV